MGHAWCGATTCSISYIPHNHEQSRGHYGVCVKIQDGPNIVARQVMDLSWDVVTPTKRKPGWIADHTPENPKRIKIEQTSLGQAVKTETKHEPTLLKPPIVVRHGDGIVSVGKRKLHLVEVKHLLACMRRCCPTCRFIKASPKWVRSLKVRPESQESWLMSAWKGKSLQGIGCAICREATVDSAFGKLERDPAKLKLSHLKQHATVLSHRKCVAAKFGEACVDENEFVSQSTLRDFLDVRCEGGSLRQVAKT